MNEVLLAETIGRDTTTQLYRDEDGGYHVRVMALPDGGGERLRPSQSPRIFHNRPASRAQAEALFRSSAAKRYVEAAEAFPGGT